MRKIWAFVLVLMLFGGNAFARDDDILLDLRKLDVKEFPVNFTNNVIYNQISTESAKPGDNFTAVLSRAIVDKSGHVLALDGAKVYGFVLESYNWDTNFERESCLMILITVIEAKDGRLRPVVTEPLVFMTKPPSKKKAVYDTAADALLYGFWGLWIDKVIHGNGPAGKIGAAVGLGFGSGVGLLSSYRERNSYKPIPAEVRYGDNWFKTAKIIIVK